MARRADGAEGPVPALAETARACAERLRRADSVLLASHIDADGLTSAAIASRALARAEIPHEVTFARQLDASTIAGIAKQDVETVLFTDFGSGQVDIIQDHEEDGAFTPVIADHHQPAEGDTQYHLNPLFADVDGASALSGAGTTYVLARALEGQGDDNRDLAALAVVGAIGDMQTVDGELIAENAAIADEGVAAGVLETKTDLAMYGTQTRPLPKLLEYASDVRIPGITGDEAGTVRFLDDLDVELEHDGEWRTWVDLDATERQTVVSALLQRAVTRGVPAAEVEQLIGTSYTLLTEESGTELRDASEFSTLLNATARYDRADVGLAVCLGERGPPLKEARRLLREHRRNLSAGLQWVIDHGVTQEDHVQWFDAGDEIRETIVGIVAGMALGNEGIDRDRPIIAFAEKDDEPGSLKVSSRGTPSLVRNGLDLSTALQEAARAVDGDGGGHDVAAGATVLADRRDAFLSVVDRIVGEQLV
ncbi:MAG: DHHA1 domain-containing protein [Halobacteriaceae archaeon]